MKTCNKCKIEKDFSEFYKQSSKVDYILYMSICKECKKKYNYKYKSDNYEKYKEYGRLYRERNKEQLNRYITDWRVENEDKFKSGRKKWYEKNKEEVIAKNYDYCKGRKKKDPLYKLRLGIRSLILTSFKSKFTKKSKKTIEILGCSFEEFYKHLESKFDEKMNWKNQGTYWHIDHIKPISLAQNEQEVYELNHYTNFQPLYWEENLKKSNKFEE